MRGHRQQPRGGHLPGAGRSPGAAGPPEGCCYLLTAQALQIHKKKEKSKQTRKNPPTFCNVGHNSTRLVVHLGLFLHRVKQCSNAIIHHMGAL